MTDMIADGRDRKLDMMILSSFREFKANIWT